MSARRAIVGALASAALGACVLDLDALTAGHGLPASSASAGGGGASVASSAASGGGGASTTTTTTTTSTTTSAGGAGGGGGRPAPPTVQIAAPCGGRLVAAEAWAAQDDVMLLMHCSSDVNDCGTDTTRIARLGNQTSCPGLTVHDTDGCPLSFSKAPLEAVWFAGLRQPNQVIFGDTVNAWQTQDMGTDEAYRLEGLVGGSVRNLRRIGGGATTGLYNANTPIAGWDAWSLRLMDTVLLVGQTVADQKWQVITTNDTTSPPSNVFDIDSCDDPIAIRAPEYYELGRWWAGNLGAILCNISGGTRLLVSDDTGNPRALDLPGVEATTLEFNEAYDTLWLWDDAGTLVEIDPGTPLEVRGSWSMPPSYAGAPLKRFPFSDAMVLGGPAVGQLTIINPTGAAGPCGS